MTSEIVLEDLVLRELRLEQPRDAQLDELSPKRPAIAVSRKLLCATCIVIVLKPCRIPPERLRATARSTPCQSRPLCV